MLPYVKQVGAMELIVNGSWETYCSSPSGMWLDYVEAMEMERNAWIELTWKSTILKTCGKWRKENNQLTPRFLVWTTGRRTPQDRREGAPILCWRIEQETPSKDNHRTATLALKYFSSTKGYKRNLTLCTTGWTLGEVETGLLTLYISVLFYFSSFFQI